MAKTPNFPDGPPLPESAKNWELGSYVTVDLYTRPPRNSKEVRGKFVAHVAINPWVGHPVDDAPEIVVFGSRFFVKRGVHNGRVAYVEGVAYAVLRY